jgi:hypothetical protein
MIAVNSYILRFERIFGNLYRESPWFLIQNAQKVLLDKIATLGPMPYYLPAQSSPQTALSEDWSW